MGAERKDEIEADQLIGAKETEMTESETSRRIADRAMMSDHASVKTIGNTEAVEVAIHIEVAVEGEMIEAVNGEMVAEASAAVSVETGAKSAGMGAMSVEMLSVNHRMTAVHHIMGMMTEPDRHVVPILTMMIDEEIETIDEIVKSNSPGDSKTIRKIFFS